MAISKHHTGLCYAAAAAVAFSPAAVFIRMADTVTSWEVACLRLFIAAATMAIAASTTRTSLVPARHEIPSLALFSGITALHFWSFTAALARTSIAHSLALTYTAPIFAAILARYVLSERLTGRQWVGIALAVLACAGLSLAYPASHRALTGDILALLSGAALGMYHTIGRAVRKNIPLFKYSFWLFFGAALYLLPLAFPFSSSYSMAAIIGILLQGILCTAFGHTLTNAALRCTATAYVSLIVTQEVTGGIVVGIFALGEIPRPLTFLALLPLLAGLGLVLGSVKATQQQTRLPAVPGHDCHD